MKRNVWQRRWVVKKIFKYSREVTLGLRLPRLQLWGLKIKKGSGH